MHLHLYNNHNLFFRLGAHINMLIIEYNPIQCISWHTNTSYMLFGYSFLIDINLFNSRLGEERVKSTMLYNIVVNFTDVFFTKLQNNDLACMCTLRRLLFTGLSVLDAFFGIYLLKYTSPVIHLQNSCLTYFLCINVAGMLTF